MGRRAIKVADEVWIACALLEREHPERPTFKVAEIVDRASTERIAPELRPGVSVHAYQHCVANRRPNPGNYRMLYATEDGGRRLFRAGDDYHPHREGGRIAPLREDIPARYHELLEWYEKSHAASNAAEEKHEEAPLAPHATTIWDRIRDIWAKVPDAEMRRLPNDAAECHDHYIAGRR